MINHHKDHIIQDFLNKKFFDHESINDIIKEDNEDDCEDVIELKNIQEKIKHI